MSAPPLESESSPAISVVMPCRNAASMLDEALDSILNQTWRDLELVAVDDGSSDATRATLESWARRDRRIRILDGPSQGLVAALNAGLEAARAPVIARMDADDRCHPERLAAQMRLLESQPELAAVSCLVEAFPAEKVGPGLRLYMEWINSLISSEAIARELYVESPLVHPSVLMRRSWVEMAGGYQEHGWAEDYDLWLRMAGHGARFGKVPQVLFYWREHDRRLTHTDSRYASDAFLRAKAHYLCLGPLRGRDAVIVWGAGIAGKRLTRYLLREGVPLVAFVDIDPAKIGRQRRGLAIVSPADVLTWWGRYSRPVLLAAVGSRGARPEVRERVRSLGLVEGVDWWAAA